jgi:hypothetical protein
MYFPTRLEELLLLALAQSTTCTIDAHFFLCASQSFLWSLQLAFWQSALQYLATLQRAHRLVVVSTVLHS